MNPPTLSRLGGEQTLCPHCSPSPVPTGPDKALALQELKGLFLCLEMLKDLLPSLEYIQTVCCSHSLSGDDLC